MLDLLERSGPETIYRSGPASQRPPPMSATYDPTQIDPASGDLVSAVRFLLQDTNTAAAELQDEELEALAAAEGDDPPQAYIVYKVAAKAARALHRRYLKQASFASGGTSVQLGERAQAWATAAAELEALAAALDPAGPVIQTSRACNDYRTGGHDPYEVRWDLVGW